MLNCRSLQLSLSAHLDGCLSQEERREVLMHLEGCRECAQRLAQLAKLRSALRAWPASPPPPNLTARLRVIASQQRARRLAWLHPVAYLREQVGFWAGNMVRPWALPFAGGLLSAIVLFAMLMPSIALHGDPRLNDVSLGLFTEPTVKEQAPFGFDDDDFIVQVSVDDQGRMVDYTITEGACLTKNPVLRRSIENYLLFTEFTPATAFGRKIPGKMNLSFSRYQINVPAYYPAYNVPANHS